MPANTCGFVLAFSIAQRRQMRIRFLLLAALMFPAGVHSQQPSRARVDSTPNGVAQTFRAFGRPYGAWLLAAFDSIPASKYDFRPTPVQQTIGYIAQHLEHANYELCYLFSGKKRTTTAKDSLADTVKAKWPKDTLIVRLRASLVFCGDAIAMLSDASLADTLTVGPPNAQQKVLRARYPILLVTDLAEHYSQLAVYMRLLGLVPPSALPQPAR
jgi:hypothetical protein